MMLYNFTLNSVKRNLVRTCRLVHVEAKIESLGLTMPKAAVPKGNFVQFVRVDNMVYLAGHLPQVRDHACCVVSVVFFNFILFYLVLAIRGPSDSWKSWQRY